MLRERASWQEVTSGAWYVLSSPAPVAYAEDEQVLGQFMRTVLKQGERADPAPRRRNPRQALRSMMLLGLSLLIVLFGAVYLVFNALLTYFPPAQTQVRYERHSFLFGGVLGGTCLLTGLTILARLPRLHRLPDRKGVHTRAWISCLLGLALGGLLLVPPLGTTALNYRWLPESAWAVYGGWFLPGAGVVYWASLRQPAWGMKPLLLLGLGTIVLVVLIGPQRGAGNEEPPRGPLWPVCLATAAGLYLWWLVIALFDLVCSWHATRGQSGGGAHPKSRVVPSPQPWLVRVVVPPRPAPLMSAPNGRSHDASAGLLPRSTEPAGARLDDLNAASE